jgi:hypothetical protein
MDMLFTIKGSIKQTIKKCERHLDLSLQTIHTQHDSFKITPAPNTDGIGNCLQQPGQLSNQLYKSMRSNLIPLIKFSVP